MKVEINRRALEELGWWWQRFLFERSRALDDLGWLLEAEIAFICGAN